MATHSSILAWEIPWTDDPGAIVHGVTRVGHDLATKPPSRTSKYHTKGQKAVGTRDW